MSWSEDPRVVDPAVEPPQRSASGGDPPIGDPQSLLPGRRSRWRRSPASASGQPRRSARAALRRSPAVTNAPVTSVVVPVCDRTLPSAASRATAGPEPAGGDSQRERRAPTRVRRSTPSRSPRSRRTPRPRRTRAGPWTASRPGHAERELRRALDLPVDEGGRTHAAAGPPAASAPLNARGARGARRAVKNQGLAVLGAASCLTESDRAASPGRATPSSCPPPRTPPTPRRRRARAPRRHQGRRQRRARQRQSPAWPRGPGRPGRDAGVEGLGEGGPEHGPLRDDEPLEIRCRRDGPPGASGRCDGAGFPRWTRRGRVRGRSRRG